jgi:hypothetical protein
MLLARRELDGEVSVESLLLGFGEAVDHIKDRTFLDTVVAAVVADLLTAEDDGVFVLHLIGKEAVVADAHLETDVERNGSSAFFTDESVDLVHGGYLRSVENALTTVGAEVFAMLTAVLTVAIVLVVEVILGVLILVIDDFYRDATIRDGSDDRSIIVDVKSLHEVFGERKSYFTFDFHMILCSFNIFSDSSKSSKSVSCLERIPSSWVS